MSVSGLSEMMTAAGCSVQVFTTTANGTEELAVKPNVPTVVDGVPVIYFKRITKDHSHFSSALLRKLSSDVRNFDIVHVHAWWNLVSVLACWVAIKNGVPVVISPRGTLSPYSFSNKNNLAKKLIHNLLGRYLLNKSFFHVTSERENRAIRNLTQSRGIFNIPNFIKLPEKDQINCLRNGPLKIIFLSRIEQKKGLEILFEALADLKVPYQLTIAGDGAPSYINKLKALANEYDLERHLQWIGFRKEDKFDILQHHDLMVLPSYDENFGNVILESLSVGTAVVVSKHVGLADYVHQNDLGWVCNNDKTSLRESINLAYKGRTRLIEIRENAPVKIKEDFNDLNLSIKYMQMYQEIIQNG